MSQYPGKALSELDLLSDLASADSFPLLDDSEAVLADKLKRTTILDLAIFFNILRSTVLKRRVVTGSSAVLSTDNLVAIRLGSPTSITLNLPNGSLVTTDPLLPPKLSFKDEGATASLSHPVTITPFSGQTIESQTSIAITNARGSISLYYVPADLDWKVIYG